MQSETDSLVPCIKLLIVCLRSELSKIRQIISRHTVLNWEQSDEIKLLPIADNFRTDEIGRIRHRTLEAEIFKKIDELAPPTQATRVLIVGHIKGNFSNKPGAWRIFTRISSLQRLDDFLPPLLKGASLDWKTKISNNLQHYNSLPQIDHWLKQFTLLKKEWIGQALLQLLDFWPDHKICEALFEPDKEKNLAKDGDWLTPYDLIIYNDTSRGDSSAIISRYVKAKWGFQDKIKSLPDALASGQGKRRIIFFEDCIMTGTECIELIKDGKLNALLASSTIDFKFAVGTQYGIYRFETFIKRASLHDKISIIKPSIGYIKNVTESGVQAFAGGRLFNANGEIIDPERHIINGINLKGAKYFNASQRSHIIHFCRDIGKQLMFDNLQRQGYEPSVASEMAPDHSMGFGKLLLELFDV
jgi:hypothetical protein